MDTKVFSKKKDKVEEEETIVSNKNVNVLDKKLLSKDDEIKALKAQLSEAKKVNKLKTGDIRAEVNRQGDVKVICIGKNEMGQRVWKKANELTDADIERRETYKKGIKQLNAKKYE